MDDRWRRGAARKCRAAPLRRVTNWRLAGPRQQTVQAECQPSAASGAEVQRQSRPGSAATVLTLPAVEVSSLNRPAVVVRGVEVGLAVPVVLLKLASNLPRGGDSGETPKPPIPGAAALKAEQR